MSGKGSRRPEGLGRNPHGVFEDEPPPVSPISPLTEKEDTRWHGEVSPVSGRSVDNDHGSGASSGRAKSQVPVRIPFAEDGNEDEGMSLTSLGRDDGEGSKPRVVSPRRGQAIKRKPVDRPPSQAAIIEWAEDNAKPSGQPAEVGTRAGITQRDSGMPPPPTRSNAPKRPAIINRKPVPNRRPRKSFSSAHPAGKVDVNAERPLSPGTKEARRAAAQAKSVGQPFATGIDMPGLDAPPEIHGQTVRLPNTGSPKVSHSTVKVSLQKSRANGQDIDPAGNRVDWNPYASQEQHTYQSYRPVASLDKNSNRGHLPSNRTEPGVSHPKPSSNLTRGPHEYKPLPRPKAARLRSERQEQLDQSSLNARLWLDDDPTRARREPTSLSHRARSAVPDRKRTGRRAAPQAEDPFGDNIANLHGDGTEGQSDGPPSFDKACRDMWRRTVEGVREWKVVRGIKNHLLPWIKQVIPWVLLLATWAIMVLEAASGPFFSKFSQYLTVVEYCEVKGYELGALGYCKANTTQCAVKPLYKIDEISFYKSLDGWDGTPLLSGLLGATGVVALVSVALVLIHAARNCSNSFCCGGLDANSAEARQGRRNLLQNRVKRVHKWTLAWWLAISVGLAAWYELYEASALLMAQLNLSILVLLPLCLIIGYERRRRPWRRQASSVDSASRRVNGQDPEGGESTSPDDTDTLEAEEKLKAMSAALDEELVRKAARTTSTPSNPLSTFAGSQNEEVDSGKAPKTGKMIHPDGRHAPHDNVIPPHVIANAR